LKEIAGKLVEFLERTRTENRAAAPEPEDRDRRAIEYRDRELVEAIAGLKAEFGL
jgi:hypothetical protein